MKNKSIVLLIVVAILMILFVIVRKCFINRMFSEVLSDTLSINAAIAPELSKHNSNIEKFFSAATSNWQVLPYEDYDKIIAEVTRSHSLYISKGWNASKPLLDRWGNRFEIKYHKLADGRYDIIVISKGPDGILGTKDDISREDYGN